MKRHSDERFPNPQFEPAMDLSWRQSGPPGVEERCFVRWREVLGVMPDLASVVAEDYLTGFVVAAAMFAAIVVLLVVAAIGCCF